VNEFHEKQLKMCTSQLCKNGPLFLQKWDPKDINPKV
jgi:hypothetical protein